MEGANQNSENGVIEPELKPDSGPAKFNITVSQGPKQHQVVVPTNSTFGDLKSVIAQKTGLKPETHKILFRGKEKDDDDHLQTAGVKDNSKVLLMEDTTSVQRSPEQVDTSVTSQGGAAVAEVGTEVDMLTDVQKSPEKVETSANSRGSAAVAEVRVEVDKLADQVAALQAVIDGGTKVNDRDFLYLTEMLMRQLLKLDSIEAEGEGKVQRKMEVRHVQSFVETLDILKSRNTNSNDTACVTTQWETFEPGCESVSTMSTEPSSTVTLPSYNPTPIPVSSTTPHPTSTRTPTLAPAPANPFSFPGSTPVSFSSPSHLPSSTNATQDWEHFD